VLNEAPLTAKIVAEKGYPPLVERLPENPVITQPLQSIGKYGGTLRTVSGSPGIDNVLLYLSEPPIKWKADLSGYEPALVESYEWSEDGKVFILHLRKGLKWSDGEPYTSEDWRFWWEDMAKDTSYRVVDVPAWLRKSNGAPIKMTFPDPYTVVWESDKPQWVNPYFMAQGFWEFATPMMKPAHYLKRFHPRYNPNASYGELEKVDKWWQNPNFPCLFAWCVAQRDSAGRWIKFQRNPFYWRVDSAGNQLPYIDYLLVDVILDERTRLDNCASGDYDTVFHGCGGPLDIPFLQERSKLGFYHLPEGWTDGTGAWPAYLVNQDYTAGGRNYPGDTAERAKEIRAILRDKRFRKALSVGFDRQRVIDVAWGGMGEPKGATLSPQSWHFLGQAGHQVYEKWAKADATMDLVQAEAWLDEMGMSDANGDGWRETPSGKPFVLTLDVTDWGGSLQVQMDAAQEVAHQWEINLGLDVEVKNMQTDQNANNRVSKGYYMLKAGHIAEIDIWTYPDWIFPVSNRYMFPLEGLWYSSGRQKGLPPEPDSPAARLQAIYEKGLATKSDEERNRLVWEAVDLIIEEGPFAIGVSGDQPMPVLIKNYMRNIFDYGVVGPWAPSAPGSQLPAQWWIDR
jgi:peptide/nickel transport system substrate-binding protein